MPFGHDDRDAGGLRRAGQHDSVFGLLEFGDRDEAHDEEGMPGSAAGKLNLRSSALQRCEITLACVIENCTVPRHYGRPEFA